MSLGCEMGGGGGTGGGGGSSEPFVVPDEILTLAKGALRLEMIPVWWNTPNSEFYEKSPGQIWATGPIGQDLIREFILSAKSGDMA